MQHLMFSNAFRILKITEIIVMQCVCHILLVNYVWDFQSPVTQTSKHGLDKRHILLGLAPCSLVHGYQQLEEHPTSRLKATSTLNMETENDKKVTLHLSNLTWHTLYSIRNTKIIIRKTGRS